MRKILLLLLYVFILDACSSGKAALKHGEYYEAVIESVNRLRGSPDNKKAKAVLQQGYPLAIQYIESNIQNGITADDPMKWRNAVKGYEQINYLNDQIKTSMGAMKIIPKPETRFKELAEVKSKAAEESYTAGINALMKNTREDSKTAYFNFKDANTYEPGFRESVEMMTQAEFNATLRVAYEEINASRVNYGSLQPVVNSLKRQFLSFKPLAQKDTVPPHQYLRIIYKGFDMDRGARTTTSTENLSKEIKVGEKKLPDGKMEDIKETVTAKITYYHKSRGARQMAMFTVTDAGTNGVLSSQEVTGTASWDTDWATFSGDARALSSSQQNLCKRRETNVSDDELFRQSLNNLQTDLSSQLQSFYGSY